MRFSGSNIPNIIRQITHDSLQTTSKKFSRRKRQDIEDEMEGLNDDLGLVRPKRRRETIEIDHEITPEDMNRNTTECILCKKIIKLSSLPKHLKLHEDTYREDVITTALKMSRMINKVEKKK